MTATRTKLLAVAAAATIAGALGTALPAVAATRAEKSTTVAAEKPKPTKTQVYPAEPASPSTKPTPSAGPARPAPSASQARPAPSASPAAPPGLTTKPSATPSPTASAAPHPRATPTVSPTSAPTTGATWWKPAAGLTWQWQLSGTVDTSVAADVYYVDAVDVPATTVAALKAAGRKTVCYVNAGADENWRPDAAAFPASVLGKGLDGWPGEKWLDIRQWDTLRPILAARFAACKAKGFDGVEPDNMDGYANRTGFPLTAADQLTFDRRVADLAHLTGLAVALKNDVDQVSALQPAFDFAVNEECASYDECDGLVAFVKAGKPVFHVEYSLATSAFCARTKALGFSSMRKHLALDAWLERC